MKTANTPFVWKYYGVYKIVRCLKINYTLKCLEYIFSISSPLRCHGLLVVKTLTQLMYSNYYKQLSSDSGGNYKYSKSNVNRTVSNLYKKRKKPCTTLLIISLENSGLSSSTHTLYTVESFINIGSSI